jgi:peptidylprolyl isomerase
MGSDTGGRKIDVIALPALALIPKTAWVPSPRISAAALILVALTACSPDDPDSSDGTASSTNTDPAETTATFPEISGEFGQTPKVEFSGSPDADSVETLIVTGGTEGMVTPHDLVASHQVFYEWGADGSVREAYSSYDGAPLLLSMTVLAEIAPEAAEAFEGQEVGTRLAMVFPPYESSIVPDSESVEDGASTLFVYDIVDRYPAGLTVDQEEGDAIYDGRGELPDVRVPQGEQPQVTVPDTDPPEELVATTLIEGDGEPATAGSTLITQFHGQTWDDETEFDSTWAYGAVPKDFQLDPSSLILGWLEGLEGVRAGSRVMLTVPPEWGYGSTGNVAVDLGPDETLVYVIDVVDVIPPL